MVYTQLNSTDIETLCAQRGILGRYSNWRVAASQRRSVVPVVADELYLVACVALAGAVDTDRVALSRFARHATATQCNEEHQHQQK